MCYLLVLSCLHITYHFKGKLVPHRNDNCVAEVDIFLLSTGNTFSTPVL